MMPPPTSLSRLARAIATMGGLGDLLPAPGTSAGSLPAVVVWWLACLMIADPATRLAVTGIAAVAATVAGIWSAGVEAGRRGRGDPGPVVIDEVAGQWVCLTAVLTIVDPPSATDLALVAVAGFFLFRVFDVVKPWPINRLETLPGGLGIVADDLAAGVAAGLILAAAWHWLPLVF
jgi:phosphatidylglycerophosphatase A